jgi:hypothetical protein
MEANERRTSHAEPILPAIRAGMVPAREERSPKAPPGRFYVTDQGIICALPPKTAPANIRFYLSPSCEDCPNHCYVHKQPETAEGLHSAIEAAYHSCVQAVRYCGSDPYVLRRFTEAGYAHLCDAL